MLMFSTRTRPSTRSIRKYKTNAITTVCSTSSTKFKVGERRGRVGGSSGIISERKDSNKPPMKTRSKLPNAIINRPLSQNKCTIVNPIIVEKNLTVCYNPGHGTHLFPA